MQHQGGYFLDQGGAGIVDPLSRLRTGAEEYPREHPRHRLDDERLARAWLEDQAAQGGPSVDETVAAISSTMALGRIPTDEECAHGVLLPLSDLFSAVTGATLDVNGGDYMPL